MAITLFGGDLRTGLIRVRNIPASAGALSVVLGGAGTVGCTAPLPMKSPATDAVVPLWDLLQPAKSFLGWEENGKILNAGPIWNTAYNIDSGKMAINAAGLRSYWQFRFVLPALIEAGVLPEGHDTVLTAMSYRTIMKRLVQQAQEWTGGSVPVVLEPDFPGTNERTYRGHELHVVDEKLKQLSEVENGPDLMFNPRYTTSARTHIEWVMETGDPELTSTTPHKWDMTGLPRPAVKGASVTRDGSVLTNRNYQTGGSEEGDLDQEYPLMAMAADGDLLAQGFPVLESDYDRTSVTELDTLQKYANQDVITGRKMLETWKFSTRKTIVPRIGDFKVGDKAVVATKDDPALGTDEHELRIMEFSSRIGDGFASVTCMPRRA